MLGRRQYGILGVWRCDSRAGGLEHVECVLGVPMRWDTGTQGWQFGWCCVCVTIVAQRWNIVEDHAIAP